MAKICSNNTSINNMWSVGKVLDDGPLVKECMTQDAYRDLC